MWELDYKESWAPKNWWFWTAVLNKTLESPLDCKEVKPVYPKGNQSWIFIGRTDAEAETPIIWLLGVKSWLIWKNPDAGKDWRQEEKGTTEDKMVGWHNWLNGHESEHMPGDGKGQGSLACCSLWGHRVIHDWMTQQKQQQQSLLLISGQGQTLSSWAEERDFSLQSSRGAESSKQAIKYNYNNKSNEKQAKETISNM